MISAYRHFSHLKPRYNLVLKCKDPQALQVLNIQGFTFKAYLHEVRKFHNFRVEAFYGFQSDEWNSLHMNFRRKRRYRAAGS